MPICLTKSYLKGGLPRTSKDHVPNYIFCAQVFHALRFFYNGKIHDNTVFLEALCCYIFSSIFLHPYCYSSSISTTNSSHGSPIFTP